MTLRFKTLLIVSLISLLFIAIFFVVLNTILLRSYADLEQREVKMNVERVEEALTALLTSLNSKTGDWANWNDAYDFVKEKNDSFHRN